MNGNSWAIRLEMRRKLVPISKRRDGEEMDGDAPCIQQLNGGAAQTCFLLLWNYLGHIDVFLFSRGGSLEFIAFVGFGWCFPSLPADLLILPLCLRLWCLQRFSLCMLEGLCCLLVLCSSGGRKPLPLSTFLLQRTLLLSEVAGRKTFCKAESSWLPWSFGTK